MRLERTRSLAIAFAAVLAIGVIGCATTPPADPAPRAATPTAPPPGPKPAAAAPAPQAAPAPTAAPAPAATMAATPSSADTASSIAAADESSGATIYVYRSKRFVGFALQPTVMLDGQDLVDAKNGTVWMGRLRPGQYKIHMDDKKSGADIDAKPGETYYFRVDIVPGLWKGGGKLTMMAREQGSTEIKDLTPLPAGDVRHPAFGGGKE